MKNFARLVRFAWPYRVRFGLSLACAVMVALLWSANISAVYPLLKILFYSENCQKWIAERIVAQQTEVQALDARLGVIKLIQGMDDPTGPAMKDQFLIAHKAFEDKRARVQELERDFNDGIALKGKAGPGNRDKILLQTRQAEQHVADAALDEFKRFADLLPLAPGDNPLDSRQASLLHERSNTTWWLKSYRWAQPKIDRFLPAKGFQTLVLLMVMVITGVAIRASSCSFRKCSWPT
ncbi:hypothetical protein V5E97_31055 [Singulisphaera sp. Ch08]|uniref:Chemotaxis methyl-accepting receptor HlyB-like 4HB MCP domain-containing protein n=1 Tax=Singulisphaera sp. Ch08 TaxID=3120278 RepID=A0AAU7CC52_9BACT